MLLPGASMPGAELYAAAKNDLEFLRRSGKDAGRIRKTGSNIRYAGRAFDPNGERNPQNRGKDEYVRISWEEAIDIVSSEMKFEIREKYGKAAITGMTSSHHNWGFLAL